MTTPPYQIVSPIRTTLWTCDHCGTRSSWGPGWMWNGSWRDWDEGRWDRITVVCSEECRMEKEGLV